MLRKRWDRQSWPMPLTLRNSRRFVGLQRPVRRWRRRFRPMPLTLTFLRCHKPFPRGADHRFSWSARLRSSRPQRKVSGIGRFRLRAPRRLAMMLDIVWSLKEFEYRQILPWRRGFGSLHYGVARRSNGISRTLRGRHGHYDQAWHALPGWHDVHQCLGFLFDRLPDDAFDGAAPTASQLAVPSGGRFPGRLHDVFQLRVGNSYAGKGRWPVAGRLQRRRQCLVRICSRLAGRDACRKALNGLAGRDACRKALNDMKGGAHAVERRRKKGNDLCK